MSEYRRWYQEGGTYFFTVVTCRRYPFFRQQKARQILAKALRDIRDEQPFATIAMVLLEDHFHAIWSLPPGDDDFSGRFQAVKAAFTKQWLASGGIEMPVSRAQAKRGLRGIWQRRFWEHLIRDEEDLSNHCDYIRFNPVKHGCVTRPADWPYSTFHRFVAAGHYEPDWGATLPANIAEMDYE
jgi:putative transposase